MSKSSVGRLSGKYGWCVIKGSISSICGTHMEHSMVYMLFHSVRSNSITLRVPCLLYILAICVPPCCWFLACACVCVCMRVCACVCVGRLMS